MLNYVQQPKASLEFHDQKIGLKKYCTSGNGCLLAVICGEVEFTDTKCYFGLQEPIKYIYTRICTYNKAETQTSTQPFQMCSLNYMLRVLT